MNEMAQRYRRWFEYEKESHDKVLASLGAVPEAERTDERFQKAVDLFVHIIGARWLWLQRFGKSEQGPTSMADLFPENADLGSLRGRLDEVHDVWTSYLEKLDDGEVAREFVYESFEGDLYRNRVEDLLTQLFGHSWHHRGQIAALIRSMGHEPAVTDYVFWTRELVDS